MSSRLPTRSRRWLLLGCGVELALGVAAVGLARLLDVPLPLSWTWPTTGAGLAGAMPLLLLFVWTLNTRWQWIRQIADLLDRGMRPLFEGWSVLEIGLLAALAGIGEELLFRGLAQPLATRWIGQVGGLALTSALFGVVHWVTSSYAVIAAIIGMYLGMLSIHFDNLAVPIVTHAFYDFLALLYWLRRVGPWRKPESQK
ncbi:MAG: CPBP family intramembrane glutamic endopeptidase [Verrucomicrobiota bacterium]